METQIVAKRSDVILMIGSQTDRASIPCINKQKSVLNDSSQLIGAILLLYYAMAKLIYVVIIMLKILSQLLIYS